MVRNNSVGIEVGQKDWVMEGSGGVRRYGVGWGGMGWGGEVWGGVGRYGVGWEVWGGR